MVEKKKNLSVVVWLSFVATSLFMIRLLYGYKGNESDYVNLVPQISPTIMPTATPTKADNKEEVEKKYPLWKKLPYSASGFEISSYVDELTLGVKVKGISEKIAESMIDSWLKENGVDPETHKIVWQKD